MTIPKLIPTNVSTFLMFEAPIAVFGLLLMMLTFVPDGFDGNFGVSFKAPESKYAHNLVKNTN